MGCSDCDCTTPRMVLRFSPCSAMRVRHATPAHSLSHPPASTEEAADNDYESEQVSDDVPDSDFNESEEEDDGKGSGTDEDEGSKRWVGVLLTSVRAQAPVARTRTGKGGEDDGESSGTARQRGRRAVKGAPRVLYRYSRRI
jgi:hypothetical protein